MLLMNVPVFAVRGVSITYAITVGKLLARESRRIAPEALQTKTSIWPGVSIMMCLTGGGLGRVVLVEPEVVGGMVGCVRFSSRLMI